MHYSPLPIVIQDKNCLLLPEKALFFTASETLILSDLHIGKLDYFRTKGIPLPIGAKQNTLDKLNSLLQKTQPKNLVFLGDLFHNHEAGQWETFTNLVKNCKSLVKKILVQGNHDVFERSVYENEGISVFNEWLWQGILFTHEPLIQAKPDVFNIAGHIHPAVVLKGKGRQNLRLSCFFKGNNLLVLPAFGHFTGNKTMEISKDDAAYVIAGQTVMQVDFGKQEK